jgi:tetratricopeptide (TPR) repeat protein
LSLEEQKTVKGLLNKTVEPFKVNAITSYKKALEKGRSLNTYNAEYLNTLYELSKIDSEYSKYRVPFVLDSKTIQFDAETSKLYPDAFKAVTLTEDIVLEKFGAGLAESSSKFKSLFALANFYHYKGFSKISNIYLDKLLKSDQKKAVVLNLRGLNKYIENDKRKAITHFRAALSEDPSNAAASFNLSSLFGKYGGFEEGYELIKEVYSSPKLPPVVKHIALNNYAVGLISKERMDEANAELKASLELASEYLPAVANMSILKTTIQKDKKLSNQYLGQYKRLAKSRVDLDRIKLLENMKL